MQQLLYDQHNYKTILIRFDIKDVSFDWGTIKKYRDRYIQRLNGIYEGGLDKLNVRNDGVLVALKFSQITRINGMAEFVGPKTLKVGDQTYTADHILVAVGGAPNTLGVPGDEHVLDSNGFFELEKQPKKVAVIGAGQFYVLFLFTFSP